MFLFDQLPLFSISILVSEIYCIFASDDRSELRAPLTCLWLLISCEMEFLSFSSFWC